VLRELDLKGPVAAAELHLEPVLSAVEGPVRFKAFSAFPTMTRDLAFLVNTDVSAERFFGEVRKLREPLLREIELFDCWGGKGLPGGQVSLAFRLTFGADRTLTDEEVDAALRKIVAHIRMTCAATLRGEL
jgi:phenylalanyl-tRNA synthetase beta chain